ncbi:MAG TPA: hypothetical protein VI583_17380 [Cyclobacteriaceae bacterium]|nr:hypothetical protein [Cyclobacteriaceae bacterium]
MIEKIIEKEFRRFAKSALISPGKCKKLDQTRHNIYILHKKINELDSRFNYVPDDARLLFNEYQLIQDRMLFENFRKDYLTKLC